MKTVVILGSTGSIGTNTLDIVDRFPEEFRVAGLTAGNNDEKLEEQIRRYKPRVVALSDASAAARLRQRCAGLSVEILAGEEGLIQVASAPDAELDAAIAMRRDGDTVPRPDCCFDLFGDGVSHIKPSFG